MEKFEVFHPDFIEANRHVIDTLCIEFDEQLTSRTDTIVCVEVLLTPAAITITEGEQTATTLDPSCISGDTEEDKDYADSLNKTSIASALSHTLDLNYSFLKYAQSRKEALDPRFADFDDVNDDNLDDKIRDCENIYRTIAMMDDDEPAANRQLMRVTAVYPDGNRAELRNLYYFDGEIKERLSIFTVNGDCVDIDYEQTLGAANIVKEACFDAFESTADATVFFSFDAFAAIGLSGEALDERLAEIQLKYMYTPHEQTVSKLVYALRPLYQAIAESSALRKLVGDTIPTNQRLRDFVALLAA